MGFSLWRPPDLADPSDYSPRVTQHKPGGHQPVVQVLSALLGDGPHRLFSPTIQVPILYSGHRALVGTAINPTAIYQTAQAAGSVSVRQRREGDFYHHQNLLLTQPT